MKSLIEYINESNNVKLVSDGKERGFDYVDLGLPSGTMWATCNIGADKPEDQGLLFQFGRVDGYKYGDENNEFVTTDDSNESTTSGKEYKTKEILDSEDDAAHVNMGGKWKMSTKDQLEELYKYTTYKVETINGAKGMLFISNINNKRLFIPFAGYWHNGRFGGAGSRADVWSSQVFASNVYRAYLLYCDSSSNAGISSDVHSYAFSVRGVFKK